jgi:DNA repair protein SbcC/Rad50
MRPIKLTLQAFGPYAGMETIDFSQLGNRTMFVISGKTGSGKTTIFDGISYAIYGKASGEDRNGPELRSQFAQDDVLTEVTLEFSLRHKRYFVSRSPQQERKKKSGDGTTTITAKAELYEIDEAGEKKILASNVRDVEEKIKEIMLIDSNQFRQILMIPQGEFRKLLTSDSKDKEAILQRLFHTEIYKIIEEKLKEEANELKRTVEDQIRKRNEAIRQIHSQYNEELKTYLEVESENDVLILPQLQIEIDLMEKQLTALKKEGDEKQKERDLLQKQIFDAKQVMEQLERRDTLKERKLLLEDQKMVYESKDKEMKLAQKAAVLAQQEELCHRLKKEMDLLSNDHLSQMEQVNRLTELFSVQEQALKYELEREDERQQAQEKINQFSSMKDDVYAFASLQSETDSLSRNVENKYQQLHQIEEKLLNGEKQIQAISDQMGEIEKEHIVFLENERRLDRLQNELNTLKKYERIIIQHQNIVEQLESKGKYFEQTKARFHDAKSLVEKLETAWITGQAAILANSLMEGDPCPVCGSNHHPQLANAHVSTVPSEVELKEAKKQLNEIELEKSKAETDYIVYREQEASLQKNVQELQLEIEIVRNPFDASQAKQWIEHTVLDVNKLSTDQQVLKERSEQLQLLKENKEAMETDKIIQSKIQESIVMEINNLKLILAEKGALLNRISTTVPENLRTVDLFDKAYILAKKNYELLVKKLEDAKQLFHDTKTKSETAKSRLVDLETRLVEKKKELETEREIFIQNMITQGFATYPIYHGAKRTDAQINELELQVRQYREEYRSVSDQLNQLSELLKDVSVPDLISIEASFEKHNQQIEIINDHYTNLLVQKRDNESILKRVDELNISMKKMEERFKIIGHLSEISKGQNTYRITFERFVLAAFLDDILREANGRLVKMTSGRYQLARKTDRSKGNVQSGLELLIFDQYTGQERHVKTLSGGESFKASLALALGLADVVQQYAGGVSLETMFIDEGFGTLDPESLDHAIEALMDIQSSGRLVGIISHVPELKERIDARLEVTATQTGSRTEFILSR